MSRFHNPLQGREHAEANLALANGKVPPTWCVENDSTYPLRHYCEDLRLWTCATDLIDERRAPAAVLRLTGSARVILREMPTDLLQFGQQYNDAQGNVLQRSGIEVLIRTLEARYGALDQETQVFSVSELMMFSRHPNETTDALIARFDTVHFRAQNAAGIGFPPVIRAWVMLTHLGIPRTAWSTLLAPTQGLLPVDEQQYVSMIQYIRRNGHLHESKRGDQARTIAQPFWTNEWESNVAADVTQHSYVQLPPASSFAPQSSWQPFSSSVFPAAIAPDDDGMSWHSHSTGNSEPDEEIDWDGIPEVTNANVDDMSEHLYLGYRNSKRRFRTFGVKRHRFKVKGRKGGGKASKGFKGKSKHGKSSHFWTDPGQGYSYPDASSYPSFPDPAFEASFNPPADQIIEVFFGGGKGKSGNPIGKDGKRMLCSNCKSPDHFGKIAPPKAPAKVVSPHSPSPPTISKVRDLSLHPLTLQAVAIPCSLLMTCLQLRMHLQLMRHPLSRLVMALQSSLIVGLVIPLFHLR